MIYLKHVFVLILVSALQISCTYGQKIKTGQEVFAPILNELSSSTEVPLRLPNYIAAEVAADPHGFSAKINKAKSGSYSVYIITRSDCQGESYCLDGLITGEKVTKDISFSDAEPVNLVNGLQGYYIKFTCAASCGMGKLFWREENYLYSVQIRAAPKNYMTDIANSAINENVAN